MSNVEIYTKSYCGYCKRAKKLLNELEVEFVEHELDNDEERFEKLKEQTGVPTVPQIFVNGKFIGGGDDLAAIVESGEFHDLFNDN